MMLAYPATIIVRDPKENPKKCSVLPIKDRADVRFFTFPLTQPIALDGYVQLSADGPALSRADADLGILLLDGSWRTASKMLVSFADVPTRSLSGWKTAYPRVSKRGTDPDNGLASIEALFAAYHILGRSTDGLLDRYHWAQQFLALNEDNRIHRVFV